MNTVNTNHFKLFPVPGVPYNVSVILVTSAGEGEFETMFYFTQQLSKYKILGIAKWLVSLSATEPNTSPRNIIVERPTPITMLVSWTPLTLPEARGFVTFYTVAYTPVLNSRRRQVSQDTMYMNVSANSSSVTIVGLDGSLMYSVQVSAGTRAGQGVQSTAQVAEGIAKPNNLYTVFRCQGH